MFGFLAAISAKRAWTGHGNFLVQLIGAFGLAAEWTFSFYLAAATLVMTVLALSSVFARKEHTPISPGAMLLAVAFTLLLARITPGTSPAGAVFCVLPVVGVIYLTCAVSLLISRTGLRPWGSAAIYVPAFSSRI